MHIFDPVHDLFFSLLALRAAVVISPLCAVYVTLCLYAYICISIYSVSLLHIWPKTQNNWAQNEIEM